MADDAIHVVVFLEDPAHEKFLVVLLMRIAAEIGIAPSRIELDIRNATGGSGEVMTGFLKLVRDVSRGADSAPLILVGRDSDCSPRGDIVRELTQIATKYRYPGRIVAAVPVPHIERWYTLDQAAYSAATGGAVIGALPFKCQRGFYKEAIIRSLRDFGIVAPLAAAPYGEEIAGQFDIGSGRQSDQSFDSFYEDLREALVPYR